MRNVDPYLSPESRFHLNVLRAGQVIERAMNQALLPVGISSAQFYILLQLNRYRQPLTPKQIGSALLVERTNLTLILDRMERDNLVQRERNPADRRSVLIQMTEHGQQVVDAGIAAYEEAMPAVFSDIDPDDVQRVAHILGDFSDAAIATQRGEPAEPVGRQA